MYKSKKKYYFLSFFILFIVNILFVNVSKAQQIVADKDSFPNLLQDTALQGEIDDAINNMYNYNFAAAETEFMWMRHRYPGHALPYFELALSYWWRIAPNPENEEYDKIFLAYLDTTIQKSYKALKKYPNNAEASFFLAGAYGFKGRLYAERKAWTKAALAGKNALKYLRRSKDDIALSPEFLFGEGLYNYYSVWIPANYPSLKLITMFFSKGDKKLGLEQLTEVSKNAFYTRTEGLYFLMRIYANEEKMPQLSYKIADQLHKLYPNNPYFHRYYAMAQFLQNNTLESVRSSVDLLAKVEAKVFGYEEISGRYASYFLGYANIYTNQAEAERYFKKTIDFAEKIKELDSGYYQSALQYLADFAKKRKDFSTAKIYTDKIAKNNSNKKQRKKARKEAKNLEKMKDED